MIKKYNGFILEKLRNDILLILESSLYGSSEFLFKLKEISKDGGSVGEIANNIVDFIEDGKYIHNDGSVKQNYFNLTDKDDMLSFLMNSKIPKDWDEEENPSLPYELSTRSEMKIGRIIKYICELIGIKITDKDLEKFVNEFKASKIDTSMKFELVDGKDISKYYNGDKYYNRNGSLGGSCMADEKKKTFDIYTENDKKVKLLVYIDSNDKIHGRALVWKLKDSPCESKYFMDRVYTNSDSDVIKFRKFAEEKGWLYKKKMNSYIEDNVKFIYKGKEIFGEITVKLSDGDFSNYPFVDTMCFLSDDKDRLSNIPDYEDYMLHSTDGECDHCYNCNGELSKDNGCYSCCEGHIELKRQGIETKWNKKYED